VCIKFIGSFEAAENVGRRDVFDYITESFNRVALCKRWGVMSLKNTGLTDPGVFGFCYHSELVAFCRRGRLSRYLFR
jgi:hypothetical protein